MEQFIEAIAKIPAAFFYYLLFINLLAFLAMGLDKRKARRGKWRIPEKTLFLLALLGGSLGGILGIYAFRHKTLHRQFTLGFPAIFILELGLIIFLIIRIN